MIRFRNIMQFSVVPLMTFILLYITGSYWIHALAVALGVLAVSFPTNYLAGRLVRWAIGKYVNKSEQNADS